MPHDAKMESVKMKKILGVIVSVVVLVCAFAMVSWAAAVGSCIQSSYTDRYLEFTWVGNNSGVVPVCVSTAAVVGIVTYIKTIPKTPAPTASHAITLIDSDGNDIAGGALTGLSATVPKTQKPLMHDGTRGFIPVESTIQMTVTGNSAGNATEVVKIEYIR